jgi:hypothetical protein
MSYVVLAASSRAFFGRRRPGDATATLRGRSTRARRPRLPLCGPRDGKTTTARIFAKALNWREGPKADPRRGTGERCCSLTTARTSTWPRSTPRATAASTTSAACASRRATADARRFKIFIVDEAHMLTQGGGQRLRRCSRSRRRTSSSSRDDGTGEAPPDLRSRCQIVRSSAEEAITGASPTSSGKRDPPGPGSLRALRGARGLRDALSPRRPARLGRHRVTLADSTVRRRTRGGRSRSSTGSRRRRQRAARPAPRSRAASATSSLARCRTLLGLSSGLAAVDADARRDARCARY